MESSQTNPTPNIPLGFASTTEPKKPTPEPVEEEGEEVEEGSPEYNLMDVAESHARMEEAEWNGKETKARLLHLALEIPQPFDGDTLNTTHPFWTVKEFTDLKTHYHTFLLSL